MSEIAFRCSYCYRVHTAGAHETGREHQCLCGKTLRVPDTDAWPETPSEELPLALAADREPPEERKTPQGTLDLGVPGEEHRDAAEEAGGPDDPLTWECVPTEVISAEPEISAALADETDIEPASEPDLEDDLEFEAALDLGPHAVTPSELSAELSHTRRGKRSKGPRNMGKGYFVAAILAFLIWLFHTSPWIYLEMGPDLLRKPLPEVTGLVEHTHYLYLERAFWSALLAGLVICLLGEGWSRSRRRRGFEPYPD